MKTQLARKNQTKPTLLNEVVDELNLWSLAGEIGFKLALPLLIFMLIGIKLDKSLGTTPLFIIISIGLALTSSVYLVYQIIQRIDPQDETK